MGFDRSSNSKRKTIEVDGESVGLAAQGPLAGHLVSLGGNSSECGIVALRDLLKGLDPYQRPGIWVYAELPKNVPCPAGTVFTVMEEEARTVVLSEDDAKTAGLRPLFRAAWITLGVHSSLEAFGLVAEVSSLLARASIPCNLIAGARHDHVLVPYDYATEALKALRRLQLEE